MCKFVLSRGQQWAVAILSSRPSLDHSMVGARVATTEKFLENLQ